jgi:hypothetical protein
VIYLLLIQEIDLTWHKHERGGKYAQARQQFPQAYLLDELYKPADAVVHYLSFYQKGEAFLKAVPGMRRSFACIEDLNLTNLSVRPVPEGCSISFFYDEHRSGMPYRRGRNQDFQNPSAPLYCKDCLNETAFVLRPGQYGRVIWNERRTDYDNGTWYYQLHVCNFIHTSLTQELKKDIFLAVQPDFEYKQLAVLY